MSIVLWIYFIRSTITKSLQVVMKYIAKALLVGLSIVGAGSIGIEDVKAYGCGYHKNFRYPYHHIKSGIIVGEACVYNQGLNGNSVKVFDEDSCYFGGCSPWYGRWDGEGNVLGDESRAAYYLCLLDECPKRKVCISNYTNDGKFGFCGTVDDIRNLLR